MSAHYIVEFIKWDEEKFDARLCQASYNFSATSLINSISDSIYRMT